MADLSRQAAREIIDNVMRSNGGITPEERADTRPEVLESLYSLRRLANAATT